MMKKLILAALVCILGSATSFAQKTTTFRFQDTQARLLDVNPDAYVKPLTVELKVIKETRITHPVFLNAERADAMKNDINNMRSYAVYEASRLENCDVIVAATFNVEWVENHPDTDGRLRNGFLITIKGYPANFVNWKTATAADYEWIRMGSTYSTSEREKIGAAVKTPTR